MIPNHPARNDKKLTLEFKIQLALAKIGIAKARFCVGTWYEHGDGVQQDFVKAVEFYQLAAAQGFAKAQFNLGRCYAKGQGIQQDDIKAAKLFEQAANQGYSEAQYNVGICYEEGQGFEQNLNEAMVWFAKAAAQGSEGAKKRLIKLVNYHCAEASATHPQESKAMPPTVDPNFSTQTVAEKQAMQQREEALQKEIAQLKLLVESLQKEAQSKRKGDLQNIPLDTSLSFWSNPTGLPDSKGQQDATIPQLESMVLLRL